MPCPTLDALHQEARLTNKHLGETRAKARAVRGATRGGRGPGGANEYEAFLQRRLQRLAAQIASHQAAHHCDE